MHHSFASDRCAIILPPPVAPKFLVAPRYQRHLFLHGGGQAAEASGDCGGQQVLGVRVGCRFRRGGVAEALDGAVDVDVDRAVGEPGAAIDGLPLRHEEGAAMMLASESAQALVVEGQNQDVIGAMVHEDAALDADVLGDGAVAVEMGLVDVEQDGDVRAEVNDGFQLEAGYGQGDGVGVVFIEH